MITCPWCGTNYTAFQSNCANCGASLPLPAGQEVEHPATSPPEPVSVPPPPPRNVPSNYAWRVLAADGGAIAGGIFLFMGAIFGGVGLILTVAVVTAFVGIPFVALGVLMFGGGIALAAWRYGEAQKTAEVLKRGDAVRGKVEDVFQNMSVEINGRNPWTVRYSYEVNGQAYGGKVTTLSRPLVAEQPGKVVYVLYLPEDPAQSTIYPHPYGYYTV